jgi:hypothetical protein
LVPTPEAPKKLNADSRGSAGARRGGIVNTAIALAAAAAVGLVALYPARLLQVFPRYGFVVHHLPGRELDGPDPIYFHFGYRSPADVNTAAIRRGGELIPNEAVFYFRTGVANGTSENVMLAARLFFLPAVQSRTPTFADWALSYRARPSSGMAREVYPLDPDLRLARLR